MVAGILASLKVVLWAMVVLLLIVYLFGVVIAITIPDDTQLLAVDQEGDRFLFGSLAAIMCALFMSITGGVDWIIIARPLNEESIFLGVAFAFFVALSMFAVFNVITGLFG